MGQSRQTLKDDVGFLFSKRDTSLGEEMIVFHEVGNITNRGGFLRLFAFHLSLDNEGLELLDIRLQVFVGFSE